MIIDFSEINYKGGTDFERFVEELLNALGWTIISKAAIGPDGGKDIIASISETLPTGKQRNRKYVVQCKHNAHSGKTVYPKDISDFILMPQKHNAQGWLLVTSTKVSQNVVANISAACQTKPGVEFDHWDKRKLEALVLDERCREILKRYFPKSYLKSTNIITPTLFEIKELINDWLQKYKEYNNRFFVNREMENLVQSMIFSYGITLSDIKMLLDSDSLVMQFLKIWDKNLRRGVTKGGVILLFNGLWRLKELNEKKLPKEAIERLFCSEMNVRAYYRNMQRDYWKEFIVFEGRDYDWTPFELNRQKGFILPVFTLCGVQLICCCEKLGEAASGKIKLKGQKEELSFISSFNLETQLVLQKFPLNMPCFLEYKLDKGSDAVQFLLVGYAILDETAPSGATQFTWTNLK